MSLLLNGTIAPWLLLGLGVLVLFALFKSFQSWRSLKRSPYFYMRRQAAQNLRVYLWVSVVLLVVTGVITAYVGQTPSSPTITSALLTNAKPVAAEENSSIGETIDGITVIPYDSPATVFEVSALDTPEQEPQAIAASPEGLSNPFNAESSELLLGGSQLPVEYDQFEPEASVLPETNFSSLVFSTDINDNYEPVVPQQTFLEGFYTIYATFRYDQMVDGLEWAWVWRYNGSVVDGGNEIWRYGSEGPGWIYYQPPEGFSPGDYSLEVWVNGELFGRSALSIESSVANQ